MSQPQDQNQVVNSDPAALSPLKRAFLALEKAQSRVAALEEAAREPVAIVGMGCRVPGGGNDPQTRQYELAGLVANASRDRTRDPSRLTPREAWNLIEALKKMLDRQRASNSDFTGSQTDAPF